MTIILDYVVGSSVGGFNSFYHNFKGYVNDVTREA
ncbi:hypothetical protein M2265_001526 [Sphingobacterium kitahiroshimense]|nr:hypothetical protein [Sphingobacterium kitahiroshimense]